MTGLNTPRVISTLLEKTKKPVNFLLTDGAQERQEEKIKTSAQKNRIDQSDNRRKSGYSLVREVAAMIEKIGLTIQEITGSRNSLIVRRRTMLSAALRISVV